MTVFSLKQGLEIDEYRVPGIEIDRVRQEVREDLLALPWRGRKHSGDSLFQIEISLLTLNPLTRSTPSDKAVKGSETIRAFCQARQRNQNRCGPQS